MYLLRNGLECPSDNSISEQYLLNVSIDKLLIPEKFILLCGRWVIFMARGISQDALLAAVFPSVVICSIIYFFPMYLCVYLHTQQPSFPAEHILLECIRVQMFFPLQFLVLNPIFFSETCEGKSFGVNLVVGLYQAVVGLVSLPCFFPGSCKTARCKFGV